MTAKKPFKIRVITSCTGEKLYNLENQLTQTDFAAQATAAFEQRQQQLESYSEPAEVMYTGQQHLRLMDGIKGLRTSDELIEVELWIISAGYGLITADKRIVPYECTFQGMKAAEIVQWSNHLGIPHATQQLLSEAVDLNIILLGDDYLRALQLPTPTEFIAPTLIFVAERALGHLGGTGYVAITPTEQDARRFACGYVGLKGELARRFFIGIAAQGSKFATDLLSRPATILDELVKIPVSPLLLDPLTERSLAQVDHEITLPDTWDAKKHREKLRFFIPDWEDMVDPDYDFIGENHSGGKGNWTNQVYAHQMFAEPNYDGLLISKAVIEKNRTKIKWVHHKGGIHGFLRVPKEFPIMGDCGAFSYIAQEKPPYETSEILDYYTNLGFDYGVSLDHLIFGGKTVAEQEKRYELTIENALKFITEHRQRGLKWTAIGAVQGWNPESYADAASQYVAMGYEYIGLGGLVRSKTERILEIAEAVKQVIPPEMGVHLFGVARTDGLNEFIKHGITSVDSASYLRKAWMDVHRGYLTDEAPYTVLRIPYADAVIKRWQALKADFSAADEKEIRDLEAAALDSVRSLARGEAAVEACANALIAYEMLARPNSHKLRERYIRTLSERPWQYCDCPICRNAGIEVMIFRGNNRNRRRGFHNTYIFYRNMQRVVNGEPVHPSWLPKTPQYRQLSFDSFYP
jgi:queuine/archaeosine tRNA-ribosyltransferase